MVNYLQAFLLLSTASLAGMASSIGKTASGYNYMSPELTIFAQKTSEPDNYNVNVTLQSDGKRYVNNFYNDPQAATIIYKALDLLDDPNTVVQNYRLKRAQESLIISPAQTNRIVGFTQPGKYYSPQDSNKEFVWQVLYKLLSKQ